MCIAESDATFVAIKAGPRLPDTVIPEHYDLTVEPDLNTSTFKGSVGIEIEVTKTVREIVLHAVDLDLSDVFLSDVSGSRLYGEVTYHPEYEQAVISFDGIVGVGKWRLNSKFAGAITNKLNGFYRSTYKRNGKTSVIASTQFEPNDARRAFPCFDEPAFKATFAVTLVVDEHLTAIANGKVVRETRVDSSPQASVAYPCGRKLLTCPPGKKIIEYARTMKMPTYIVAWVVGEFEVTEPITVNNTDVRVYCVPGKKHLANFALKAAQFSLTWFEEYFNIKYPGDKLDMIGIPDFAFGAMENLGCVTFRETALLVDDQQATMAELSRVAEVVAHEIAHMWFGNLVTMKWWNGLWLNEAFATFMATKVEEAFKPEWQRWNSFGVERAAALRTDGLASTRAIEAPVTHAADALGMIDVITYRKGCSVLRQLEQYIGERAFRNGIRVYLRKHSYANAETTDLWEAIGSATREPVSEMMSSWVFQSGYPLVSVARDELGGSVTLKQTPFKYLSESVNPDQQWLIPVHLRYKSAEGIQTALVLLDETEKTVYLGEQIEWVVLNAHGHGFYRTLYSPELAGSLAANLNEHLTAIERFNFINDAWACLQAGLMTGGQYVDIVRLFGEETDPNVWSVVSSTMARIYELLPERNRSVFAREVRKLGRATYERLGWSEREGDTAQDRQVRGIVIGMLGTIGHSRKIGEHARELFASYKTDRSAVAPDVAPAVISLLAHYGGAKEYAELQELYQATQNPQEKVRFLMALTGFRNVTLLEKTLAATITPEIRSQDAPTVLVRLLNNQRVSTRTWEFIKNNWDYMVANYSESGVITLTSGVIALDRPELEEDVRAFFAAHKVKGGDKAVSQNLELLRIAVRFKSREAGTLATRYALPVIPDLNES